MTLRHSSPRTEAVLLGRGLIQLLLLRPFPGVYLCGDKFFTARPPGAREQQGVSVPTGGSCRPLPSRASVRRWCSNTWRPMTLVRARVSGRSTWGHCAPVGPHWRPRLEDLGELFAAGAIGASQSRPGSGDLRIQIAGIDAVLAEVAYSTLAAPALADNETTLIERWEAASAEIKRQDRR